MSIRCHRLQLLASLSTTVNFFNSQRCWMRGHLIAYSSSQAAKYSYCLLIQSEIDPRGCHCYVCRNLSLPARASAARSFYACHPCLSRNRQTLYSSAFTQDHPCKRAAAHANRERGVIDRTIIGGARLSRTTSQLF